jgi:outer membrane receptor protein involved in Fe transport
MTVKDACATRVALAGGLAIAAAAAAAPAIAADAQPTLAEVVVTATKRSENVQDVPVSVSVQSGQTLLDRGQSQLADYASYIPGFIVSNEGSPGLTAVTLRGISTITSTSAVGTYLDDTPVGASSGWVNASTTMLDLLPYDLDRLEVLMGPQGTLYGAGAMGGLIKYVMKAPSTTEYEATVGAEGFSIDGGGTLGFGVSGRVSLPVISNVLGVSLSVFDRHSPGWMTNLGTDQNHTNDAEQWGGRIAVQWTPTDTLSVKLSAMQSTINSHDVGLKQFTTSSPVANTGTALLINPEKPLPDGTENVSFLAPYNQRLSYYSATVDWNAGPFDVISATSWSSQRSANNADETQQIGPLLGYVGGSGPGIAEFIGDFGLDKWTQEFRLVSPQGKTVDWLFGVFYTYEASTNSQYGEAFNFNRTPMAGLPAPVGFFDAALPEKYDEYAAFGDVTWNVTDKLSVTGGGRYAKNDQDWNTTVAPGPLVNEVGLFHVGTHEGVGTWMADVEYHFVPDTMGYLRAASGYRPGGPNSPIAGIPQIIGSDSLVNYEVGFKSTFLDKRAVIDMALFHIDWKNMQLIATTENGDLSYGANGGKAVSQGIEFAGTYSPVEGLVLGVNYAYTDSHLTSVIPQASYLETGYQLAGVPKQSFSVTANYEWPLTPTWKASVGGGYRYIGEEYLSVVESASPASTPSVLQPGYSVVDLNAHIRNEHLTIKAYVKNLTNNDALTAVSENGGVVINGLTGNKEVITSYLQPRTVGVGVDYRF